MENVTVRDVQNPTLVEFLQSSDFFVEQVTESVYKVNRSGEPDVFLTIKEGTLFFEVDLGSVIGLDSKELYFTLLDLNTEILPVSVGIDTTEKSDPRLVIVESREISNLDSSELLSVFDSFEIAADKIEAAMSPFIN
jgi:hypothetical protein